MTALESIADRHLREWYLIPPTFQGEPTPTLRERCVSMMLDALDEETDGLATKLKLAEEDARMGWELAMDRGAQLQEIKAMAGSATLQRYALCPKKDGKRWWVLEAMMPCNAGEGRTIAPNVGYDEMRRLISPNVPGQERRGQ